MHFSLRVLCFTDPKMRSHLVRRWLVARAHFRTQNYRDVAEPRWRQLLPSICENQHARNVHDAATAQGLNSYEPIFESHLSNALSVLQLSEHRVVSKP